MLSSTHFNANFASTWAIGMEVNLEVHVWEVMEGSKENRKKDLLAFFMILKSILES